MTIERVERLSKQTRVAIESATCDRCGRALTRVTGIGVDYEFPFRGISIDGRIYAKSGNAAETKRLNAELCDLCVEELIVWIGADDLLDREFTYKRLERD